MCAVGLWPTYDIRTRNPELDCLGLERILRNLGHAPDNKQGHGDTSQR